MTKKMTKKEMFTDLYDIITDLVPERDDLLIFINHEIELLNNKSSAPKKPTKTQIENESLKGIILTHLTTADTMLNISEMQEAIPELANITNQRITHLLTALVKDGKIEKEYIKRKPYFSIKH